MPFSLSNTEYTNTSNIIVRSITNDVARQWIIKYHYTHNLNRCQYALGVYYKISTTSFFDTDTLIGVIVYSNPVGRLVIDSIAGKDELFPGEVLELVRLHILDGYGKNIESYVIGQSFEWLRNNAPQVKMLISYADPEQGHTGLIYRATNWLYQGCGVSKLMVDYDIRLSEDGPWIHSRTVGDRYGNRNPHSLAARIGHTYWRKQETSKHRYIYFLCNKKEKKRLMKLLKLPILPYSNIQNTVQLIQKVHVKDGKIMEIETIQGIGSGKFIKPSEVANDG